MDIPFHPMIVHFPIALLITSVLFELLGRALHKDSLRESALWLLGLGLGSGVAAYLSGKQAEEAAEHAGIPETLVETHETLALITLIIFGILFLFRYLQRNNLSDQVLGIYLLIAVIGIGTLGAASHDGGKLVYGHGAGVQLEHLRPLEQDHDNHED